TASASPKRPSARRVSATATRPAAAVAPPRARRRRSRAGSRGRRLVSQLLFTIVPVFLISTFLTFALGALAQTSPAAVQLGDYATPDAVERLNREFGLDDPFLVRYVNWL